MSMIVGQRTAVRTANHARYRANRRRPVIIRAPVTGGLVRFTKTPLETPGLSFFAYVTADGTPVECGVGDDYAEALVELHGQLVARL